MSTDYTMTPAVSEADFLARLPSTVEARLGGEYDRRYDVAAGAMHSFPLRGLDGDILHVRFCDGALHSFTRYGPNRVLAILEALRDAFGATVKDEYGQVLGNPDWFDAD